MQTEPASPGKLICTRPLPSRWRYQQRFVIARAGRSADHQRSSRAVGPRPLQSNRQGIPDCGAGRSNRCDRTVAPSQRRAVASAKHWASGRHCPGGPGDQPQKPARGAARRDWGRGAGTARLDGAGWSGSASPQAAAGVSWRRRPGVASWMLRPGAAWRSRFAAAARGDVRHWPKAAGPARLLSR
jgi:hypothetical protein